MDTTLLLVGTGSGLSHSLFSAVSKSLLTQRIPNPFLFLIYINTLQAIITPVIWFFTTPAAPPAEGWLPIVVAAATCTAACFLLYMSLSCGDVSSVMPMMGSKVIFSGLLAHLMLGERHSGSIYLATALVALAVAALGYSPPHSRRHGAVFKPMALMLACCMVFACTDVYMKRSLVFVDVYSFTVYYNLLVAGGSLLAIPYLRMHGHSVRLPVRDVLMILLAAAFLMSAVLLFVLCLELAGGVVIPNILMSTRGIFIVLISALSSHRQSTALDTQPKGIYLLRLAASILIVFAIWLALK
jgi:drug/metabolite transporter (DMT)-like permease